MKKLPKIITQIEFEQIFKAEEDKEYKLAFLLGFESGLRISEIVGLKNKDGTWKISPLTPDKIESAQIRIEQGKGQKDRIVPKPKRLNENAKLLLPINKTRRALQWKITQLGERILKKKITFHTLRHGFGTHLANSGRPLHEIQMLMGHSRLDTTGIYLHANPKQALEGASDTF